jgi:hypothetical protein
MSAFIAPSLAAAQSVLVAPGAPGIDTSAPGQLKLGALNATSIGLGGPTGVTESIGPWDVVFTGALIQFVERFVATRLQIDVTTGLITVNNGLKVGVPGGFAAGDHYALLDAAGNIHKSALGPAS